MRSLIWFWPVSLLAMACGCGSESGPPVAAAPPLSVPEHVVRADVVASDGEKAERVEVREPIDATEPTDPVAAAAGYQRQLEHDYAHDPTSPFAAVASHYLGPNTAVTLAGDGEHVNVRLAKATDRPTPPAMHFVLTDKLTCTTGCGAEPLMIDGRQTLTWGDREVLASPQATGYRLLVYDASALARRHDKTLRWFSVDAAFIVDAAFEPLDPPQPLTLTTTRGLQKQAWNVGSFAVPSPDGEGVTKLTGYAFAEPTGDGVEVLVPFVDATTNHETYGTGRYLEFRVEGRPPQVRLDFNRAHNPLCAYSPHFNCPVPPRHNRLPFAVRAGEKRPAGEH